MKKILSFLFVCLLAFIFVGCTLGGDTTTYSLSINDADKNVALEVGDTKTIAVIYEGGTLEWKTSDGTVVSVENGTIKALKAGSAVVTVSLKEKEDYKATISVTVTEKAPEVIEVTGLALAGKKNEVEVGDTFNVNAVITPTNATDKTVTWASSDPTVATVENGKVTALKAGTTEISAKAGSKTEKFTLTVSEKAPVVVDPEDIYLDHTYDTLKIGETDKLEWGIDPEEASQEVEWTITPEDCASISEDGTLTALKGGVVTIKVSPVDHPEISDSYELRIFDNIEGITIKGQNSMQPGSTQTLKGEIDHKRPDGTTINTMSEFKWESTDPEVATINDAGLVTALKEGTVTIKAIALDSGKYEAEFTINVAAMSVKIGETSYQNLDEALTAAKENDIIDLGEGTFSKELTLNKSSITIRGNGTVFAAHVQLADGLTNVKFVNIEFAENGYIDTPQGEKAAPLPDAVGITGLTFDGCKFSKVTSKNDSSLHFFVPVTDFTFVNNQCEFKTNRGIRFEAPTHNWLVDNNTFINTSAHYDTIRAMDLADGTITITNNLFDTCVQSLIQIRYIGTGTYNVLNNTFKNAACVSVDIREAKVADFEGKAVINVKYNTFDGGENDWGTIRLRNSYGSYDKNSPDDRTKGGPLADDKVEVNINYNKFINIEFDADTTYYVDKPTPHCTEKSWNIDKNYSDKGEPQAAWFSGMDKSANGWFGSAKDLALGVYIDKINSNDNYLFVGTLEGVTKTPYESIAKALEAAKAGDVIALAPGTYTDAEITKGDITIVGPNAGIDKAANERNAEAEFTGTLKIVTGINNITIDGLAFIDKGSFNCVGDNENITLLNLYVHDTDTVAWKEGRDNELRSTICFNHLTNDIKLANVTVSHCYFENLHMAGLYIARILNVKVDNCTFHNFDQDAIRGDGGYNNGKWEFLNNKFYNDTLKGTNGIYLQSVSGDKVLQEIYILNNEFTNIGDSSKNSQYMGAFCCRTYQECGMKFYFMYNTVNGCINGLHVRNNGEKDLTKYVEKINYNAFIGVTGFYHRNFTADSSDTSATNPVEANFDFNYFEDAEGNALTYDNIKDRLFEVKSCENTFETKAAFEAALAEQLK